MPAVLAWSRIDLRRRWRSLVVLVLLVAVASGVILATLAGARRTDTALDRLRNITEPADVMVLPNIVGFDWNAVANLPSVKTVGTFSLSLDDFNAPRVIGAGPDGMFFAAGDPNTWYNLERFEITRGVRPDPSRVDEALASPGFIKKFGSTVTVEMASPALMRRLDKLVSEGKLDPTADLPSWVHLDQRQVIHIVGEGKSPFGAGDPSDPQFIPSYGFWRKYIDGKMPDLRNALIKLKAGEAGIPAFKSQLAALTHNKPIDVVDLTAQGNQGFKKSTTFTARGWVAFAAVALLASLVLIGQAFVRFSSLILPELETLAALGLERRQSHVAAALGPALAGGLGCALGVGLAIALSPLFPTALARDAEPNPGVNIDGEVLGIGAAILVIISVAGALIAARSARHQRDERASRPSAVAAAATRLGLGVVPVLGTRFALEAGRGRSRVPVRPALIGAIAAVLGVVGALTFREGLDRTADDPVKFGQTLPEALSFGPGKPPPGAMAAVRKALPDPAIAVLDDMRINVFNIAGQTVTTFGLHPLKGHVDVVTLAGRPPATANEVSLSTGTAAAAHLGVGDHTTIDGKTFTVSGITFVPEDSHNDYTDGAWMTGAAMSSIQPDLTKDKYHRIRFAWAPGTDVAAAEKRLGEFGKEIFDVGPPAAQADLTSVRVQPLLLGGFLVLLGVGALGNALATAVRKRRHDLAIMRSLGMTRRQARLTVAMQATTLAAVGVVFGIPLGLAAGRYSWHVLADATPVVYTAPLAALALLLVIPGAVTAANALAAWPARRAAQLQPAEVLRAE
jgi:hypothetical protein